LFGETTTEPLPKYFVDGDKFYYLHKARTPKHCGVFECGNKIVPGDMYYATYVNYDFYSRHATVTCVSCALKIFENKKRREKGKNASLTMNPKERD